MRLHEEGGPIRHHAFVPMLALSTHSGRDNLDAILEIEDVFYVQKAGY